MFEHWPEIFNYDATLTSAVLDRLLHRGETVTVEGRRFRMKDVIDRQSVPPPVSVLKPTSSNPPIYGNFTPAVASPDSTTQLRLNPDEPPWYGPVCPVVWEGRHCEVPPYPYQSLFCKEHNTRYLVLQYS